MFVTVSVVNVVAVSVCSSLLLKVELFSPDVPTGRIKEIGTTAYFYFIFFSLKVSVTPFHVHESNTHIKLNT